MARGKPLEFDVVPIEEAWKPDATPPVEEIGSVYDPVFRELKKHPGMAVKITKEGSVPLADLSAKDRERIQSGLKVMAKKNRQTEIETRIRDGAVYARLREN